MEWKNYSTQKCIKCKSKSYRDGKTENGGYQLYKCTNPECRKRFDTRDIKPEPLNYLS